MKTCIDCGIEKQIGEYYITPRGKVFSACKQCTKTKVAIRKKNDPFKALLSGVKARAKREGVPFNLTEENIQQPTHCPVFGIPLVYGGTGKSKKGYGAKDNAASVDRIVKEKGYVVGNVNVISWKANRAKAFLTNEEIQKLAEFFKVT